MIALLVTRFKHFSMVKMIMSEQVKLNL